MEIIVGRQGTNQKITILDRTVSRQHCKLTAQSDGTYLLENISANGTFVDGRSVIKTVVTEDAIIQLGPSYKVKVADIVGNPNTVNPPVSPQLQTPPPPPEPDYTAAFNRLESVYDRYSKDKVDLLKEERRKNQYRSLPMFAVGIVSLFLTVIPALEPYRIIIVLIATACAGWGAKVAFGSSIEIPERMEALNRQFKIDYVCPKCGNFLGDIPFENLKNKKVCSICKCTWIK